MAIRLGILATFALGIGTVGSAQPLSAKDEVALAVHRGTLLYAYDQAAWHGSDDFQHRGADLVAKACGRVVTGPANATELAFVDCTFKSALYRARFNMGKLTSATVVEGEPSAPLTELEQQTLLAGNRGLEVLTKTKAATCSKAPPNFVVLPPEAQGAPALVYLLTPQTDLDTLPLGGHHRVSVNADGSATSARAFTKACLNLPKKAAGGQALGLFLTHLLDPAPTEIHVFTSLSAKIPIYVGTRDRKVWRVDGNRVAVVDEKAK